MGVKEKLEEIYDLLYKEFGPQHWWPGETKFEIIVGAILTQNTNWSNVEKAVENLKKAQLLTPKKLYEVPSVKLATYIKSAGYYNIKAKRLKSFLKYLFEKYNGSLRRMFKQPLHVLREELLSLNGIGSETADSILLYAGEYPIFVVDAYTKRILSRHNLIGQDAQYHELQQLFMDNLPQDVQLFNEYHALLVRVGKEFCKKIPQCERCILKRL